MAKRQHRSRARTPAMPVGSRSDLRAVEALLAEGRYAEARDQLEDMDRERPDRPEVLALLVSVNLETGDLSAMQHAAERLLLQRPDDPDLLLALGGSYLLSIRPALALRTFRRFVARWPNHPEASKARASIAGLEQELPGLLREAGLEGDGAYDLAVLHEQAQVLLEAGEPEQARQTAERLLRQRPEFVAGLNNLSQIMALEGRLEEAMAMAQRVLARDPDNFHALGNLTKYCCMTGQYDQAHATAARLKAVTSSRPEVWTKKAEALSYLGDDAGVVDAFRGAERAGLLKGDRADPWLYHLAAVAEARLGRLPQARRRWQRALKLDPTLTVAQANLDDLKQPVGERHAPWPFVMGQWLSDRVRQDLADALQPLASGGAVTAEQALQRFVQKRPEALALASALLDRGDPIGRQLAFQLAVTLRTPELLAALRDFALGQRGPDLLRQEAATVARRGGLLPSGPLRLWMQGEWRELVPMSFQITDEPEVRRRPQVQRLAERGHDALLEGKPAEAERLLDQALALDPDSPDLMNNLAVAYGMQGRTEEANALARRTHERFPEYLFACTSVARLHIRNKEFDQARALLDPLLEREQFHISEFAALCEAQVEFHLAKGEHEGAESWLAMWESVSPDHPRLDGWRMRVRLVGGFGRLLGRRRRSK